VKATLGIACAVANVLLVAVPFASISVIEALNAAIVHAVPSHSTRKSRIDSSFVARF
jgi:hypothetical protein